MTRPERIVLVLPDGASAQRGELRRHALARGFRRFAVRREDALRLDGHRAVVPVHEVGRPSELAQVLGRLDRGETLAVRWTGDRVIPLESVVARRRRGGRAWVITSKLEQVPAALGALEHGADVVAVEIRDVADVDRLEQLIDVPRIGALDWRTAPIRRIEPVGSGDRVLVDTTRLLGPREGMLVGSSASFLFCVTSEATGSAFSAPRPFRVNAGAAHSYLLLADRSTRYLAELSPGDPVLVVGNAGAPSTARVGRLKTERRPLVMIEVDLGKTHPTIFVQEAETVRLMGMRAPKPVTELRRGDRIRGVRLPPARHLGAVVEEGVEER
jgi:3-dehydroquinate synthase II